MTPTDKLAHALTARGWTVQAPGHLTLDDGAASPTGQATAYLHTRGRSALVRLTGAPTRIAGGTTKTAAEAIDRYARGGA